MTASEHNLDLQIRNFLEQIKVELDRDPQLLADIIFDLPDHIVTELLNKNDDGTLSRPRSPPTILLTWRLQQVVDIKNLNEQECLIELSKKCGSRSSVALIEEVARELTKRKQLEDICSLIKILKIFSCIR